jgi:hypothetical protein
LLFRPRAAPRQGERRASLVRSTVGGVVLGLAELLLIALAIALVGFVVWGAYRALQRGLPAGGPPRLPAGDRAWVADQIARARWAPAHDEVEGTTRILLRRGYTGLDGHPAVLEERVFESFPSDDPAWEARFTEGMANARYRCTYLNAEDSRE